MILKHFYILLESEDYLIKNPEGSEFPYSVDSIVSDFNSFQTEFFSLYIERELKKIKFETNDFNTLVIRGRKEPREYLIEEKHHKSITLEVKFDEERYKNIYPHRNTYPIDQGLLKPIEDEQEFSDFLFEMTMEGLQKENRQEASIPYDFLMNTLLEFKSKDYKNEWIHKKKSLVKTPFVGKLKCNLTCNYLILSLILETRKEGEQVFYEEILKTLPSSIVYKNEFNDLIYKDNRIIITDNDNKKVYESKLDKLIS